MDRRYVEEASGGQIGYICLINTAKPGQSELVRKFNGRMTKPGLINGWAGFRGSGHRWRILHGTPRAAETPPWP